MADIEKHPRSSAFGHHAGSTEHLRGDGGQYQRQYGNPAPLGLFSFASTTFILSFYVVRARGIMVPNLIVAMALVVGGLVQLLAGMWEFARGNTFAATTFSSYGGFYMSVALLFIPWFNTTVAYTGSAADDLEDALGFYFAAWFIFTFLMFIGSHRSSVFLTLKFFLFMMAFLLVMVGMFTSKYRIVKAGGAFGIATSAVAYYLAAADLWTKDSSYVQLPIVPLGGTRPASNRRV